MQAANLGPQLVILVFCCQVCPLYFRSKKERKKKKEKKKEKKKRKKKTEKNEEWVNKLMLFIRGSGMGELVITC